MDLRYRVVTKRGCRGYVVEVFNWLGVWHRAYGFRSREEADEYGRSWVN